MAISGMSLLAAAADSAVRWSLKPFVWLSMVTPGFCSA